MKIQCDVDEHVWRAGRVFSLESGRSMGELVTDALKGLLQDRVGPVVSKVVKAAPKPVSEPAKPDFVSAAVVPGFVAEQRKIDQKTCKHYWVDHPEGRGKKVCSKCGFEP